MDEDGELEFEDGECPLAGARGELVSLEQMQRIEIESVNSKATIRRLLLDQASAESELKQRELEFEGAILVYEQTVGRLEILLDNYLAARVDLDAAYYANPAYRVWRDVEAAHAEKLLERAKLKCYRAVRRLEYAWAERFTNAYMSPDSPWVDASSVFRVMNSFSLGNDLRPDDPAWCAEYPEYADLCQWCNDYPDECKQRLSNFLGEVKDWDAYLENIRTNEHEGHHTRQEPISLREHVLGLSDVYLSGPYTGQPLQDPPEVEFSTTRLSPRTKPHGRVSCRVTSCSSPPQRFRRKSTWTRIGRRWRLWCDLRDTLDSCRHSTSPRRLVVPRRCLESSNSSHRCQSRRRQRLPSAWWHNKLRLDRDHTARLSSDSAIAQCAATGSDPAGC